MNLAQACDMINRYGNVGRSPDDLLKVKPTEAELQAAKWQVLRHVERAFELIKEYHNNDSIKVD